MEIEEAMTRGVGRTNGIVRFLRHIMPGDISGDGCWRWRDLERGQRGSFSMPGSNRTEYAARASYALFIGPIPDGVKVTLTCGENRCVRPDHLFLATSKEVARNAGIRGQISRGAKHRHALLTGHRLPGAKLRPEQVTVILARSRQGHVLSAIAKDYDVSPSAVQSIVGGRTWTHVTRLARRP